MDVQNLWFDLLCDNFEQIIKSKEFKMNFSQPCQSVLNDYGLLQVRKQLRNQAFSTFMSDIGLKNLE